jgi:hypothetical protein
MGCHGQPIQLIVSVDMDDPCLNAYVNLHGKSVIINHNRSAVDAVNNAAKVSNGDIIIVVSDDTDVVEDWNEIINEAVKDKSDFLLKTFDGVQKWICTMPVMDRTYYNRFGFIYNPAYAHCFCDTELTHIADLTGRMIIRNDILFPHNHYSVKGGQPKDQVNIKADSTWDSGKKTYLNNCRNKFGLGDVDIFKLSKEATQAGHVAWLKKELRRR